MKMIVMPIYRGLRLYLPLPLHLPYVLNNLLIFEIGAYHFENSGQPPSQIFQILLLLLKCNFVACLHKFDVGLDPLVPYTKFITDF